MVRCCCSVSEMSSVNVCTAARSRASGSSPMPGGSKDVASVSGCSRAAPGGLILVAASAVGVADVLGNGGSAHALTHFSMLGYHLTGSAGTLFLNGIVVGAAGLLGLILLLAGARRRSRRGSAALRRLRQSRLETGSATT
jgi:hypothetical protein